MYEVIRDASKEIAMLVASDVKPYRIYPYILSQVGFNKDSLYTAGVTYVQKFRALTSGMLRTDITTKSTIRWERTSIHAEGEEDVFESGSVPSNHLDIMSDEPRYVQAGAVLTYAYTRSNRNAFRVVECQYVRPFHPNSYSIDYEVIDGATIDVTRLEQMIGSIFTGDTVFANRSHTVKVSDVLSLVTYNDIQEDDELHYILEPVTEPVCTLEDNDERTDYPQLRFSNENTAVGQYGLGNSFTIDSAIYADWTSIGNGLEAKGTFVKNADYFVIINPGWSVFHFEGNSYRYAPSFVAYSEGTSYPSYWPYYADQVKAYCRNKVNTANAGGAHYNSLYLIVSKSGYVGTSIWKVIIKSSTSGENDIVIDNISFSSIRSLFGTGAMREDDIIKKGTGFSYTYSTDYVYDGSFTHASFGGSSLSVEVRAKDVQAAMALYNVGYTFSLETEDYADWTEIAGGLEIRGFTVKNHDYFVLIAPPEWIEYPDLGIKIKAQHGYLLQAKDMIVPIHTLCSSSYHQWDYYIKTNGSVSGKASWPEFKRLPHIYTNTAYSGDTEEEWYINGVHAQTNSISSTKEGILIPGSEIRLSASKMGGTFNVLGDDGWKYMRNGVDISESIDFDVDAFFVENLFEEEGVHTVGRSAFYYGIPSGWTIEDGDSLVIDVRFRNKPQLTVLNNVCRDDFFEVRIGANVTRSRLFDAYAGGYNSKYGGGMYYRLTGTLNPSTGEASYRNIWYNADGAMNFDSGFDFDFRTYLQNHPDEFPITMGKKLVRFVSNNGSFGEEIDGLLTDSQGNPWAVQEGDYFEFCFERKYHYGECDAVKSELTNLVSSYVTGAGSVEDDGWVGSLIQIRGTFVIYGDRILIAPLSEEGGGDEPGGGDIPTEQEYVNVTFDAETNGGECNIYQYRRKKGSKIGVLPVATKIAHVMTGWFTQPEGGSEIRYNTIVNSDMTVYAQFAEYIEQDTWNKKQFPYHGSGLTHDVLMQTRPKELDPALGNTFRVVVRGYFRNPQENGSDKHLGLYVLGSYDYKNWQLYGWKEKRLSDAGFHDIGCETYRASMKYIMVILTGQLADGSHIDKIDMTGIGRYNNKLK